MTVTLPPELADLLHRAGGKWPETDEDGVRTVATAWRDLSTKLTAVREDAAGFATRVIEGNRGASIDAFADYWREFDGHLDSAITASAKTAEVADGVASATERTKQGMVEVLQSGQRKIAAAERMAAVPVAGAVAGSILGPLLRWLLPLLGRLLWWLLRMLWRLLVWLAKLIWQGLVWLWKKIVELFKRLSKQGKPSKPKLGKGVKEVPRKPLTTERAQIEAKYKHAKDFGVNEPRGKAGFEKFETAVKSHVDDPATMHINGTYHGQPAIINYNPNTGLAVVQKPTGEFVSGWRLSPGQVQNVLERGKLGGG